MQRLTARVLIRQLLLPGRLIKPVSISRAIAAGEAPPADPLQAERQQLEQERAQLAAYQQAQQQFAGLSADEQQLWTAEQQKVAWINAAAGEFRNRYPDIDITNANVLNQLAAQDPPRFAQLQQDYAVIMNEAGQYQQLQQRREQLGQQRVAAGTVEFNRVAELHDQAWMARHEELQRDPAKLREFKNTRRSILRRRVSRKRN